MPDKIRYKPLVPSHSLNVCGHNEWPSTEISYKMTTHYQSVCKRHRSSCIQRMLTELVGTRSLAPPSRLSAAVYLAWPSQRRYYWHELQYRPVVPDSTSSCYDCAR